MHWTEWDWNAWRQCFAAERYAIPKWSNFAGFCAEREHVFFGFVLTLRLKIYVQIAVTSRNTWPSLYAPNGGFSLFHLASHYFTWSFIFNCSTTQKVTADFHAILPKTYLKPKHTFSLKANNPSSVLQMKILGLAGGTSIMTEYKNYN